MTVRYVEAIEPQQAEETAEEVISRIKGKIDGRI